MGKLRKVLNEQSKWHIGRWFDTFLKFIIPALLFFLIASGLVGEFTGIYGHDTSGNVKGLHIIVLVTWILFTVGGSFMLTKMRGAKK